MEVEIYLMGEVGNCFVRDFLVFVYLDAGLDQVWFFILVISSFVVPIEIGSSPIEVEMNIVEEVRTKCMGPLLTIVGWFWGPF